MANNSLNTFFIFVGICFVLYLWLKYPLTKSGKIEGMTSAETQSNLTNGLAGNASAYGANIKAETIQLQDTLLISKYRTDYENVVLNLEDYINNLMLQTALQIDTTKPHDTLSKLAGLSQAKTALNSIMKFVDAS